MRWPDNETDFAALLEALRQVGYAGAFCVEYVPMPKWRCDEIDVVTEALAARAALLELGVSLMERLCHVFRSRPGREEEYVRRHVEIWPEMVEAMKAAGFANYTLFRRGLDVIAVASATRTSTRASRASRSSASASAGRCPWRAWSSTSPTRTAPLVRYEEDWHLD